MSTYIDRIQDKDKNTVLPITSTMAVYDSEGIPIGDSLKQTSIEVDDEILNTINDKLNYLIQNGIKNDDYSKRSEVLLFNGELNENCNFKIRQYLNSNYVEGKGIESTSGRFGIVISNPTNLSYMIVVSFRNQLGGGGGNQVGNCTKTATLPSITDSGSGRGNYVQPTSRYGVAYVINIDNDIFINSEGYNIIENIMFFLR